MKRFTFSLLAAIALFPLSTFAQTKESGLFVPGNSLEMRIMNVEPVCWVNEANELNVFIQGEDRAEIISMIGEKGTEMPVLPKIVRVSYSTSGFMLNGEDGTCYFFGVKDKEESKQTYDIMKYGTTGEIKNYGGMAIASHQWRDGRGPELEELRAAKSIYDILGE
jgi:hypothetical protein